VALLLKDREAGSEAAGPPPDGVGSDTAPDFACESCGAAMERGQDWCLDCGTAAPGRLGARPGWRAAFTVVGVTTMLLLCAVVAAYAALTGDAERSVLQHGVVKLAAKGVDLLVVNEVGAEITFDRPDNAATILSADGEQITVSRGSKAVLAARIWDAVSAQLCGPGPSAR